MSSVASSSRSKSVPPHKLNAVVYDNLPCISYERTVSKGKPVTGAFRISGYATKSLGNRAIPVQKVDTFQDYISGCKEHEDCLGHFCITPGGNILLPQRLSTTMGVMSNQYAKMVEKVFSRDNVSQGIEYASGLRTLMLGKRGKMRGDMLSGPVDGNMREVINACWKIPRLHIAVPERVMKNMKILRIEKDEETGLYEKYYKEDHIREGDYVLVERPPPLGGGSDQPMKVVPWKHESLGLQPSHASEYHADHDGDEMHLAHLTHPQSIIEAKQWKPLTKDKFEETLESTRLPYVSGGDMNRYSSYMVHTTLSLRELCLGEKLPPGSKSAKMKEDMADMYVERQRNQRRVYLDFPTNSINGIVDVMNQRLNQGPLGDMLRQARMAASCVSYEGEGLFHLKTHNQVIRSGYRGTPKLNPLVDRPLGGNPATRAVDMICSVAQQAALDSHRVSRDSASKMDLISNFVTGAMESLVVFKNAKPKSATWYSMKGDLCFAVVNNTSVGSLARSIVAAYNPVVLTYVGLVGGNIKDVCRNGILVVTNYYGISLSRLELEAISELMSYRVEASTYPITTRKGLYERSMKWMVVLFANHYGILRDLQDKGLTGKVVRPDTISDALSFGNFDFL